MRIHDLTHTQHSGEVSVYLQRQWLLSGVASPGDIVYRGSCYSEHQGWAIVMKTKDHQAMPLCLVSFTELNRWVKHGEDPFGLLDVNNFKKDARRPL